MTQPSAPIDPEALLAHGDFVRGIARSLLFDEHAADDVVQQTWIAALGSSGVASRGWLGAVARNLAIKRLRGDRRRAARETAVARPEGVPSDGDVRERERLRRSVVDAVLALDEPYRSTVLLRWFDGLPPRGVAARMDVPVETVRTRTRRALELLRRRLDARHAADRRGFCAGLAVWAGEGPRGEGTGAATAAATGGVLMASKTVAAGVVVLAIGAYFLWPRGEAAPAIDTAVVAVPPLKPVPPPRPPRAADEPPPAPAPAPAPPVPAKPVVKGRVADAEGRPAAGMTVWVTGPEVVAPDASGKRSGNAVVLTTDADGRFETTLPSSAKCTVMPMALPGFEPKKGERKEVTPPDEHADFVVERKPTATLVVTAFDVGDAKEVAEFTCAFGRRVVKAPSAPADGKIEALVRLDAAAGDTVKVAVTAGGATAERDVAVRENERIEVRVEIRRGAAVSGNVTDATGKPLAGALVFFGEEDVGRGDEPFKPFDEKRIRDGVRTGADGRFAIRGTGRWITFWHADASPVTVARDKASAIALPARGAIRGVLRGADGAPLATTKVFLDRVRETTTDADGRFAFDAVEAGTRGLSLVGGKPKAYLAAVRVTPGAASDVDVRPGIASVRIAWQGHASLGRFVALVPLGAVGSLAVGQPSEGTVVAPDVLPGRYVMLGEGGIVATVDVSGAEATAVVGRGEIVVRAAAKTRVFVVPEGAGYLARLMAGRMAGAGVPADGALRFTGLAPGRYEVGVERDGVRVTVDVKDAPVEVPID